MSNAADKKNTFFGGVAVLMAGIAIVKVLGALFKIPIGNILGDVGFGHFNNAYVVFNLLLMISTAGLPIALSKTIAESDALGRRNQVRRNFHVALITFLILGLLSSAVMFFFAGELMTLQGDKLAKYALQAIAPTGFLLCVVSAFRGFAQGHGNMVPTSVSQIIESAVKVVMGILLAVYLMKIAAGMDVAAAGAMFGVTMGSLVALIFLIVDFFRRGCHKEAHPAPDKPDSIPFTLKRLMIIAIPITIGASIVPITTWLDTIQVQTILTDIMNAKYPFYQDKDVEEIVWGIYGAYQKPVTIFNLPSSFMVAITACIIPFLSASLARGQWGEVRKIAESSMRISSLVAFPAGIGIVAIASPVVRGLYFGTNYAVAEPCMFILGIASIFICIMTVCTSILQASGYAKYPIFIMAIGCAAKLLTNNYLVRQEGIGVVGAPIGTLVCYAIVAFLELLLIKKLIPQPPSYRKAYLKNLAAALIMGGATWAAGGLFTKVLVNVPFFQLVSETGVLMLNRWGYILVVMGAILVAVVVYAVLIVLLKAVTREDLSLMPKGDKIAKILRIPE